MSGRPEEERRVEELLRVNAELAAELRDLTLNRAPAPRSGALGAARRLARLVAERDALAADLEATRSELAQREQRNRDLEQHHQELARRIHDQAQRIEALEWEVARLRAGTRGLLRRLRARLLRPGR